MLQDRCQLCFLDVVPCGGQLSEAGEARSKGRPGHSRLQSETVDFNGLGIKSQTLLLIYQELLDIFALVSLKLNHLTHLRVCDDGAIASELLLDDLEDLLLVELLGQALDGGQSLATITLCTVRVSFGNLRD